MFKNNMSILINSQIHKKINNTFLWKLLAVNVFPYLSQQNQLSQNNNYYIFGQGHAHGVVVQSLIIHKFPIFTQIFFCYGLNMNKTIVVIDSLLYQLLVVFFKTPLFCRWIAPGNLTQVCSRAVFNESKKMYKIDKK